VSMFDFRFPIRAKSAQPVRRAISRFGCSSVRACFEFRASDFGFGLAKVARTAASRFALALLYALCVSTVLSAPASAVEGAIRGRVTDGETRDPLIGANVVVKGTYKGAAAGPGGEYVIQGLSEGDYTLEASVIGYKVELHTGVKVVDGQVTHLDFALEPTVLALGQEVVIVGDRPLIEFDVTSSRTTLSSREVERATVTSVDGLLGQQMGVVRDQSELHVRGGRADESLYMVDGLSIKDPLSGYGATLYISKDAVEELSLVTGGFNAEYGQAMSGIIEVKTKDGGEKLSGSASLSSDRPLEGLTDSYGRYDTDLNIGGPEPISEHVLPHLGVDPPGDFRFFVSGHGLVTGTDPYLPEAEELYPAESWQEPFAVSEENDWHLLGKLTWRAGPTRKLSVSYDRSLNINQGYFLPRIENSKYFPYEYSKMLDNYNTITQEGILSNLSWTHTLSPRTFYEVTLGRFFTSLHSAVRDKHWTDYEEHLDNDPVVYIVQDDLDVIIRRGDGFYDAGDAEEWFDYYSDNLRLRGALTSRLGSRHEVKCGLESEYTEMQVIHITSPWVGESGLGRNHDFYKVYPNSGALFVQDKVTFEGMIANLGLRYDYWFPGEYVEDAIANEDVPTLSEAARERFLDETTELFGHRFKGHLSPRLGVSHPVTDNDMLYFYYGHFSQRPKYWYVYAKLGTQSEATYQLFGNPNLSPTTTVAYELGLNHRFNDDLALELKAYYKDMFDYATAQKFSGEGRYAGISYLMYINMDFARSRGIEAKLRQRWGRYFWGTADFAYSIATGKSSTPNDNLLVEAGVLEEKPLGETYLRWDKPVVMSADFHFQIPRGDHPSVLGLSLPSHWGADAHWELQSGKRYTKLVDIETERYEKEQYSSVSRYWNRLDARLWRSLEAFGASWTLYLEAENIFDYRVATIINPITGRAYEPGDPFPPSWADEPDDLPPTNPARFEWPRRVWIGASVHF
jgi:outer membrane receptor protein involved in Fe transport